jgi:hypothetical protein
MRIDYAQDQQPVQALNRENSGLPAIFDRVAPFPVRQTVAATIWLYGRALVALAIRF